MAHPTDDHAEIWLQEHDPDYETSRLAWRHIRGADYARPSKELGGYDREDDDDGFLSLAWAWSMLAPSRRRTVDRTRRRKCEHCGGRFEPKRPWHRFCRPACRLRAWRER